MEGLARQVLQLSAEGRRVPDATLVELARTVINRPEVVAARRVLDGGDDALAAGVELAGLLVGYSARMVAK